MKINLLIVCICFCANSYAASTECPSSNPNGTVTIPDNSTLEHCNIQAQTINIGNDVSISSSQFYADTLNGGENDLLSGGNIFTVDANFNFLQGGLKLKTGTYQLCNINLAGNHNTLGSGQPGQTCNMYYNQLNAQGSVAFNCNMTPTSQYCSN